MSGDALSSEGACAEEREMVCPPAALSCRRESAVCAAHWVCGVEAYKVSGPAGRTVQTPYSRAYMRLTCDRYT